MKYADIKREVLSHINQYTMAGSQVAPSLYARMPVTADRSQEKRSFL